MRDSVPSNDVKILPLTADSIFCTSDTPISPISPISPALSDVIGARCWAPTTGYLVAMRGVSKEFQRREREELRMSTHNLTVIEGWGNGGGDEAMMQGNMRGAELFPALLDF
jgi:hypothetical protein